MIYAISPPKPRAIVYIGYALLGACFGYIAGVIHTTDVFESYVQDLKTYRCSGTLERIVCEKQVREVKPSSSGLIL